MTDTDGLVAFLRARLDDDEQVVRRAPVDQAPADLRALVDRTGGEPYLAINPSRVLAEVEAKRRIVGRHAARFVNPIDPDGQEHEGYICQYDDDEWPCADLRDIAAPYADHPDYRPSWRP